MLVNGSRKLKGYGERIYLHWDEPPETRSKAMDILKQDVLRDGKSVKVHDDQLYIENAAVFTLRLGSLCEDSLQVTDG